MPFIDTQNASIYYECYLASDGNNNWLTLINGYSRSCRDFHAMARYCQKRDVNILLFDNRGAGQTKTPAEFSLFDIVKDIQALWSYLNITGSHVLGISMGGMIALELALNSNISDLILVSTTPSTNKWLALRPSFPENLEIITESLKEYFAPKFVANNLILIKTMAQEMLKRMVDPNFSVGLRLQQQAVDGYDASAKLAQLTIPVCIIHGQEDRIVSPKAANYLAQNIRNAKITIVPNIGHLFLAEAPQWFYQEVYQFVTINNRVY